MNSRAMSPRPRTSQNLPSVSPIPTKLRRVSGPDAATFRRSNSAVGPLDVQHREISNAHGNFANPEPGRYHAGSAAIIQF